MRIIVDNRVRVPIAELDACDVEELKREFEHANHAKTKLVELERQIASRRFDRRLFGMAAALRKEPEKHVTWKLDGEHLSLPRGGIGRVVARFPDADVVDATSEGDPTLAFDAGWKHRVELRDYQRELVRRGFEEQSCLWRSPTGSGKTSAAIGFILEARLPAIIVVWTGNLLAQWVERLGSEVGLAAGEIGVIGGGVNRQRPITVAMLQTIRKWTDDAAFLARWGTVVFDEVDRAAAVTAFETIEPFPARYRIGVSADERRKDRKEPIIYDLFGPVAAEVRRDDLEDANITLDVEIRIVPTGVRVPWFEALPGPQRGYALQQLLDELVRHEGRNAVAFDIASTELAHGQQVIALSHRVEHCHRMRADVARVESKAGLLLGGAQAKAETEEARTGLVSGAIRYAAGTYQAVGYGLDIPTVGRGIATTPIHNNRTTVMQVRGRLCRTAKGKADAALYYLWDEHLFGNAPIANLVRWNRRVVVRVGSEWVDARHVLKQRRVHDDDGR